MKEEKLGRISEIRKNVFIISFEGRDVPAKLKGSFYGADPESLPVVGDWVDFAYEPAGDSMILSVRERKSLLKRPDQAKTAAMQYMAANVDICFIVTSLNGDYSFSRIARYVSLALSGGARPVVILTKADLCGEADRYVREARSVSDGVSVHAVSAKYGEGMEALKEYFIPGVTIALMGSSGAGKSTLINALAGGEVMKTGSIREADSKGRHTTTCRRLITLSNGVCVIDTPGMREIGVAEAEEGLDRTFADIIALEEQCRFRNCRHGSEPGCAVKAAIASGELSRERYELYKSLGRENAVHRAAKKEAPKAAKAHRRITDQEE